MKLFRDFLNEMTGGSPVGDRYSYSWRVPFRRKDGIRVDVDFSSHKTLTLLEIWLTKYGHFTDEELKDLRVEPDNKFFGGMRWDEAYEKYRKIRLKRNNLEQYYVNYTKPTSSEKIIPKDLVHLKQLVRDNIRLDKIIIPKNITSLSYLFHNEPRTDFNGLETWDVSHITEMYQVFFKCEHFTGKGLEKWDVSNVTDMRSMFSGCKNFTGKAIENWNVGKVTEMGAIFSNCDKFNADLSRWKVHNVKNMTNMFFGCKNFTGKGLENWNTKKLENIQAMFYGCKSFSGKSIEKWDLRKIQDISFKSDLQSVFEGSGVKNYPENFIKRFSFPEYKAPPKKTRESEFKRKFEIDYSKAPKRVQELWDQYDIYTEYIDDLKEQQKAERENDFLEKQIREILNK